MSDISITFPPGMMAWLLLGEALPVTSAALVGLLAIFFFAGRGRRRLWLWSALALVGAAWLGGISVWAAALVDRVRTDIYVSRHHFRLDKTTIMAGIEVPAGSWVWTDEQGTPYGFEIGPDAAVSIDGAAWRGDIQLILPGERSPADHGVITRATLAADAVVQGIPCQAGGLAEFIVPGGDLLHCTAAGRTIVPAEIADGAGGMRTVGVACAAGRDLKLRVPERLLEGCVLAESATVGSIVCAGGAEIALDGAGLALCTLASAQRIGPFELPAAALVRFNRGRLDTVEMPATAAPLAVSGVALPGGSTLSVCERAWEAERAIVPEESYVTIAGVKLTGGLTFDCGRFRYGSLFEATELHGRPLPRHASVSWEDLSAPPAR